MGKVVDRNMQPNNANFMYAGECLRCLQTVRQDHRQHPAGPGTGGKICTGVRILSRPVSAVEIHLSQIVAKQIIQVPNNLICSISEN